MKAPTKTCPRGHTYPKSAKFPVCPKCWPGYYKKKTSGKAVPYIKYHNDDSIWAKGYTLNGKMTGVWTWFRKDGTKMRSGTMEKGKQIGKWTTYNNKGKVVKVTMMK